MGKKNKKKPEADGKKPEEQASTSQGTAQTQSADSKNKQEQKLEQQKLPQKLIQKSSVVVQQLQQKEAHNGAESQKLRHQESQQQLPQRSKDRDQVKCLVQCKFQKQVVGSEVQQQICVAGQFKGLEHQKFKQLSQQKQLKEIVQSKDLTQQTDCSVLREQNRIDDQFKDTRINQKSQQQFLEQKQWKDNAVDLDIQKQQKSDSDQYKNPKQQDSQQLLQQKQWKESGPSKGFEQQQQSQAEKRDANYRQQQQQIHIGNQSKGLRPQESQQKLKQQWQVNDDAKAKQKPQQQQKKPEKQPAESVSTQRQQEKRDSDQSTQVPQQQQKQQQQQRQDGGQSKGARPKQQQSQQQPKQEVGFDQRQQQQRQEGGESKGAWAKQQQSQQQPKQEVGLDQQKQQEQQRPQQQRPQQQQQRPQQQRPQQQQQRPQQQQQWPQQQRQDSGQSKGPWQQQSREGSVDQRQQQRPQQQQQWSQQQRPQQQQQRPQQQQQRQDGGQSKGPWQQQSREGSVDQRQQQRPQQQQQWSQQQRPQQQRQDSGQSKGPWQQQSREGSVGQGQQQRPQQQQQWSQQQRPQQQQQRQDSGQSKGPWQQQSREGGVDQRQQQYRGSKPQESQQQYQQREKGGYYEDRRPQQAQAQRPSEQQLMQQFGPQKEIPTTSYIPRGTAGKSSTVETNYLRIDMEKMPSVAYHYDVSFNPDRPKKFLRQVFRAYNVAYFPNNLMAFDGSKSFYTAKKLECDKHEGDVEIHDSVGKVMKFKLTIKETADMEIDLTCLKTYTTERVFDKPMRALQCLDVVLASACEAGVRAGRSFYAPSSNRQYDLDDGYEMWLGLYQAMVLGDVPLLNVDVSHKSFPKEFHMIDYLRQVLNINNLDANLDRYNLYDLSDFLKNINIVYTPPKCFGALPKMYKCLGVSDKSALNATFDKDGEIMTIDAYFKSRDYKINYPQLNLLIVGSSVRSILLPMELCSIPAGQAINKKNSSRQIQKLIRYAATSTNERKERIMDLLTRYQHNANSIITAFGIKIDPRFIVVSMRILNAPKLEYFQKETVSCFKGAWRADKEQFIITGMRPKGHSYAILYYQEGARASVQRGSLEELARMLCSGAERKNLQLAKPDIAPFKRIEDKLLDIKNNGYDFIIVVIPDRNVTYSDIKKAAELKYGLLTQCIKAGTFRRLNSQLIDNILLKINAKLNGTNHIISAATHVKLEDVMYMGADVTHPSPDQRHIPSVVGVVGSHDINGANYNMQYRLQSSKKEVIEDMEGIFTNLISVYFKHQKKYPKHVIYFRDGVSDGQFPQIEKEEIREIRIACKKLRICPKITCIIVIKRHHTRFYPQRPANDRDKFNNVEPGSVVDRTIVHPNEIQFFLCSHQAIQGTAKPGRYNVIVDDAKMNIDDIQKMCYNMCHLFPRCNRAVSYPAPAYLSHLVAFRGRVYLENVHKFGDLKTEYKKREVMKQIMDNNPMFFV
ncbi:protein argonaute-2 isoform X2 [Teleopsis dalmanni]|uniref:protein argonaute-2 isoform X2 n=1 Tax=Teleopsis dalmanni TaxID=139649 RepID=UPI0018CF6E8F|nr:protein argonaute-2 isoform X2 [Teleopsis dalmanni]